VEPRPTLDHIWNIKEIKASISSYIELEFGMLTLDDYGKKRPTFPLSLYFLFL
jgi:hypothetical protein